MKIFVKPNPFWEIILYAIGIIIYFSVIFIIVSCKTTDPFIAKFLLSMLIGWFIIAIGFILGVPFYWLIESMYEKYKLSYPKKEKSEKIQKFKNPIDYEVNIYKNKLKN